jgi:hypothetical protein
MPYNNNRPTQLESMRKCSQDKLYARQPALMRKLQPFLNKAQKIQDETEPILSSPDSPLSEVMEEPILNVKLSKSSSEKLVNSKSKKVSGIKSNILWNLK